MCSKIPFVIVRITISKRNTLKVLLNAILFIYLKCIQLKQLKEYCQSAKYKHVENAVVHHCMYICNDIYYYYLSS